MKHGQLVLERAKQLEHSSCQSTLVWNATEAGVSEDGFYTRQTDSAPNDFPATASLLCWYVPTMMLLHAGPQKQGEHAEPNQLVG